MVNWKTKYLKMKLKYINTKLKGGSNSSLSDFYGSNSSNSSLSDFYKVVKENIKKTNLTLQELIDSGYDLDSEELIDFVTSYSIDIKLKDNPEEYSRVLIDKILFSFSTQKFYLLKDVREVNDETKIILLSVKPGDDFFENDDHNDYTIINTEEISKSLAEIQLEDLEFYASREDNILSLTNNINSFPTTSQIPKKFYDINPMLVENEQEVDMFNPVWILHKDQDVPIDLALMGWIRLVSLKGTIIYFNINNNQKIEDFDYNEYEKPQRYSLHNRIAFTIDEAILKQSEATDKEDYYLRYF